MKVKKCGKKSFRVSKAYTNVSASKAWTIFVIIISFLLSVAFGAVTNTTLKKLELGWAFVVLLIIIGINIVFDMIGTATQAADEIPFHSLASRKARGSSESVMIIRHAPQVANLCCDVVGDIAGIISGGATALIVAELVETFAWEGLLPSLILTGFVSSLTIGGKALSKSFSMKQSNQIVFIIGKIMNIFNFSRKRKKKRAD